MKIYFNTQAFSHHYHELDITDNIAEAELLVMGAKQVDIEKFRNLKAVYRFGAGVNNVPLDYLKSKQIPVYFPSEKIKEVLFDSTANFTSYLILHMYYCGYLGDTRNWRKENRDYLGKKTLLVIGTGNIGARVVLKMKSFMDVKTYDIKSDRPEGLRGLISLADFVSLHIPLTNENKNFIDKEKLSWMKNNAVLINTSRGILVDEGALFERLSNTNMRAAFDVFWVEPYSGRLSTFPKEKFFMTPHTSSQTKEFIEMSFSEILEIDKRGG